MWFPPYSTSEIVEILRRRGAADGYILTPEAADQAAQWIDRRRRAEPTGFGNACTADGVFNAMETRLALRVAADPATDTFTFIAEDVPPCRE
ncbi:hypothetical protein [Phaeacidiphilus oryzae]|uniref:hypothetical protein n=1 Tax=Phaeacidiphilus oryzae TaxID=348818 RepID=UPI000569A35F|nr:hypothetical protein [Phaeacidiphilus oryzae]